MSRTLVLPTLLSILVLLSGRDSSASLVRPDAEFSFSAPVLDAEEATDEIEAVLAPLGFKITRRPKMRDDGFFRAEFERRPSSSVSLSGRVSCVHVAIYMSWRELKTAEAVRIEAGQIYEQLLASLRSSNPNIFLFKSGGGKGACEEAL
jgi:hypothetical protein